MCFISIISERLAQTLYLPRSSQNVRISGVAGLSHGYPSQSTTSFSISSRLSEKKINVTAIVVQRVTCDLPLYPVPFDVKWKHLTDLQFADPMFGHPGRIDVLLGVDVFTQVLLQGRRIGPPGSPVAFQATFGWVLAGTCASCYSACYDTLLVGPTIHPPLIDVLLRFRLHRVALTADVSRMYRAVMLPESDRDFLV